MKGFDWMAAEEMANGNDIQRVYNDALTAQLGERVTNLGRRQSDLESEMRSGFKQMETAVSSLASEMRTSVASLSTNMAERNKPQWQAIGVALTFCAMFGGIVWWPVNTNMTDFKMGLVSSNEAITKLASTTQESLTALSDKVVSKDEMKLRTDRAAEDRARNDDIIADIRSKLVPREENEKVNAFLQKQLDEIKGEMKDRMHSPVN